MDTIIDSVSRYTGKLGSELVDIAKELDTGGWAVVSGVLLVCGWFFLKGSGIRAA